MAPISKGQLISRDRSTKMTRRFRWSEAAAVGKGGQHVAVTGILNLWAKSGRKSEVPTPLSPSALCLKSPPTQRAPACAPSSGFSRSISRFRACLLREAALPLAAHAFLAARYACWPPPTAVSRKREPSVQAHLLTRRAPDPSAPFSHPRATWHMPRLRRSLLLRRWQVDPRIYQSSMTRSRNFTGLDRCCQFQNGNDLQLASIENPVCRCA
jgi:hypothetical protein